MKFKKFAMLAVVFTLLFALSACSMVHKSFTPSDKDNLALSNTIKVTLPSGKTAKKLNYSGNSAVDISFSFPKELEFNTILISETQKNIQITHFEWWTTLNGESKMLYKQDEIGKLRYCYVDNIKTNNLTLKIVATDGDYKLENFGIYNTSRPKNDFRVTTYIDGLDKFITPKYTFDRATLNHVTHAILFRSANFDENGNLNYNLEEINTAIKLIKEATNGKPPVIMLNILNRDTTKTENESRRAKENIYYGGMKTNKDKLIKNIVKFLEETGADGISFDYEFPSAMKDHLAYSKFLVELNNTAEMVISVAYADWNLGFSKSAIKAVDYFELMAYDLDDSRGNHSGFENCAIKVTNSSLKFGIPREKINLGVPFYSRPIDMVGYWGTYNEEAKDLDQFDNFAENEILYDLGDDGVLDTIKARWYNSPQMIKDKTAFAYDIGLGGMMIWHFACDVAYDNDMSLLKAMNSVLD